MLKSICTCKYPLPLYVVQIEDLSSQAQIQAAEKFKAPEVSAITGKEAEEETAAADGGEESEGEEVSLALILS